MSIETDELVFVQVQKTGSTFVSQVLLELGARRGGPKHHRVDAAHLGERLLVASCRDPWDWYVSMYAFASVGQGRLQGRLTRMQLERHGVDAPLRDTVRYLAVQPFKRRSAFRRALARGDAEGFRRWLGLLHGRRARWSIAERYAGSPVHRYAGLYTWRYLYLLAADERRLFDGTLRDPSALPGFLQTGLFAHHLLRNETLGDDLLAALARAGRPVSPEQAARIVAPARTNPSQRSRDLADWYDPASVARVAELDGALAAHFGYAPPDLERAR